MDKACIEITAIPTGITDLSPADLAERRQRGPLQAAPLADPVTAVSQLLLTAPVQWYTLDDFMQLTQDVWSEPDLSPLKQQFRSLDRRTVFLAMDRREKSTEGYFLQLRVYYPKEMQLVQAVRFIEEHEYANGNPLPAALLASVYAALTCLTQPLPASQREPGAPMVAGMMLGRFCRYYANEWFVPTAPLPAPLDQFAITALGERVCQGLGLDDISDLDEAGDFIPPPNAVRATDTVRALVEAGRQLWTTKTLREIIATVDQPYAPIARVDLYAFSVLTTAYLWVKARQTIEIAGVSFQAGIEERHHTWIQVLELTEPPISSEAVRALLPQQHFPVIPYNFGQSYEGQVLEEAEAEAIEDAAGESDEPIAALPSNLLPLITDLRHLADQPSRYQPSGLFQMAVPKEIAVLHGAGMKELKVYLTPSGMWLGMIGDSEAVVSWTPGRNVRDWVVPREVAAWLTVVAEALWADVHRIGSQAVPRQDGRDDPVSESGAVQITSQRTWDASQSVGLQRILAFWALPG